MAVSADSPKLREGRPFDPYGAHRDDPYSFLAGVADAEPVFYAPLLDAWCVTRREDMVAVLKDDRSFSARDHNPRPKVALPDDVSEMFRTWRGAGAVAVGSLDPPEHGRIREVLNIGFTPAKVRAFEPTMRQIASDLAEKVAADAEFDFISGFAVPYALEVMCRRLGVPDSYLDRCRLWSEQRIELMMLQHDTDPELLRAQMARQSIFAYDRTSRGAQDYQHVVEELLGTRRAVEASGTVLPGRPPRRGRGGRTAPKSERAAHADAR